MRRFVLMVFFSSAPLVLMAGGFLLKADVKKMVTGQVETSTIYIDGYHLAMERPQGGGIVRIIWRAETNILWVVDKARKQVLVIDPVQMEETRLNMEQALAEAEAKLAEMPEEQQVEMRRRWEQQMAVLAMSSPSSSPPRYELLVEDQQQEIDGRPCRLVKAFRLHDGARAMVCEMWVTSWDNVPLSEKDFDVFRSLDDFFMDLLTKLPARNGDANPFTAWNAVDGFPLKVVTYHQGQPQEEVNLTSIEPYLVPSEMFEVPAEYKANHFMGR